MSFLGFGYWLHVYNLYLLFTQHYKIFEFNISIVIKYLLLNKKYFTEKS